MAKTSYPNQDMVTIHKERYDANFLQVGIDEWTTAFNTLKPGSFGLYLYLCGNMDGYHLALSSAAVQRALGYSDSTYRRAKKELIEKEYLVVSERSSHVMDFFPTPPVVESSEMTAAAAPVTSDPHASAPPQQERPSLVFLLPDMCKTNSIPLVYTLCRSSKCLHLFSIYVLNNGEKLQFTTPYWLLWYMLACIFYQLLLPLYDTNDKRTQYCSMVLVFIGSLLVGFEDSVGYYMSLSRFFVFQPWFLLGYYCKKNGTIDLLSSCNKIHRAIKLLTPGIIVLSILFIYYADLHNGLLYGSYSYSNCNSTLWMRVAIQLIAFCWILFLFVGVKPLLNKKLILLTTIGQNTWPIFLLHGFFVKAMPKCWPSLLYSPWRALLITCALLVLLGNKMFSKVIYYTCFLWLEHLFSNSSHKNVIFPKST